MDGNFQIFQILRYVAEIFSRPRNLTLVNRTKRNSVQTASWSNIY